MSSPEAVLLEQLNKLTAATTTIAGGLESVAGNLPLETLRRIQLLTNTITKDSGDAAHYLHEALGSISAGAGILENTEFIIDSEHEDYRTIRHNLAESDSDLSAGSHRENSIKEISQQGSAATNQLGLEMNAKKGEVELTLRHCQEILGVIATMWGIVSPQ